MFSNTLLTPLKCTVIEDERGIKRAFLRMELSTPFHFMDGDRSKSNNFSQHEGPLLTFSRCHHPSLLRRQSYVTPVRCEDPETEADAGGVPAEGEGGEHQDSSPPRGTRQTVTPALHGCTLEVKKGELVAVVGAVGSGKSR